MHNSNCIYIFLLLFLPRKWQKFTNKYLYKKKSKFNYLRIKIFYKRDKNVYQEKSKGKTSTKKRRVTFIEKIILLKFRLRLKEWVFLKVDCYGLL